MRVMTLKMLAPAFRVCCAVVVSTLLFFSASAYSVEGHWVHAYAAYGEPKYPKGFTHFEYVNPDAPKRGTLYLRNPDRRTSFDKFNPYTIKGSAPAGVTMFLIEPLAVSSSDEPQTMYGLLAQEMLIASDKSSITFRLNPLARFHNGDPVLAQDVKYSHAQLTSKYSSPAIRSVLSVIKAVVVLDERTVRFDLNEKNTDALFTAGAFPVFSRKWGEGKKFDEVITEYPIGSGPYQIAEVDTGRRIEFERVPQYWANDLPVRKGFFNFSRVVYRYYLDEPVAREAFKAGEFDLYKEYVAASWARQHQGPKWRDGRILKDPFETQTGQGLQSHVINLRRPLFQDARVRFALAHAYDFDFANKLKLRKRANSLFNNSAFAADGLPSEGELKLLEPFRAQLPAEVFGPPYRAPETGLQPKQLRANLLKARALLEQAGWKLAADGLLRNAKGDSFEFEYLTTREEDPRPPMWQGNLRKLGIRMNIRVVDFALFRTRLDEYDFDVITLAGGDFTLPSAALYEQLLGSKAADEKGNQNFRGVKSAAVDHLIKAMSQATTLDALRDAARALDRVVMWNHWQVPDLYTADEPASYWNRFGMPSVRPKYFTLEAPSAEQPPWAVTNWWIKDGAVR
jgi:peptide/nickel transport system substrate-binding protein/microcin C transport system substrate-binding protein